MSVVGHIVLQGTLVTLSRSLGSKAETGDNEWARSLGGGSSTKLIHSKLISSNQPKYEGKEERKG